MAETNGTQNGVAAAIDYSKSVKKQDFTSNGVVQFIIPTFTGYETQSRYATLPDTLPPVNRTAFFQYRDIISMVTPYYESMWAASINVAVTKAAAWGWEVESPVPLRQKRIQQVLLNSTAYVMSGWVNFISAHLRSFLLSGKAFVEIERESSAYSSRIVAIHHLNPLRCRVTDDPEIPVEYYDRKGKIHQLKYYQVMIFADMLDPTEGEYGIVQSAVSRAYDRILLNAAINRYLYEKVSGKRPLALHFVQGTTSRHLEDYIGSMEMDQARKGGVAYMGAGIIPIPGDNPVTLLTVPLAELPDGFDAQQLRDDAYLIYAKSIGLDPNDVDPRIAAARNLGAGAQSVVLSEKAKGQGLAAWRKQWEHAVNNWVADSATTFAWSEENTDDQIKTADLKMKRAQTRDLMIKSGEITAEQARNLAVDDGDLPREFLEKDITAGGALSDNEKPIEDTPEGRAQMARADVAQEQTPPTPNGQQPPNSQPDTAQPAQKPTNQEKARAMLQREKEASEELVEALGEDWEAYKHLGGQHDQSKHGHGGGKEYSDGFSSQGEFDTYLSGDKGHGEWMAGLSDAEKGYFHGYTSKGDAKIVNGALRDGDKGDRADQIDAMQKKLKEGSLSDDRMLYRGFVYERMREAIDSGEITKGNILTDNGFMSTTVSKEFASPGMFSPDGYIYMRIKAPKGTRGAFMGKGIGNGGDTKEMEFLLPHGSRHVIDAITKEGKTYILDTTIIGG